MKLDDMLLEQRLASSILTAECDRLQSRNEKLEKVAAAAKLWLSVADIYSQHRLSSDRQVYKLDYMQGREIFRSAVEELEQA